eukprot:CAMPEP_0114560136 /NCGR_PEP_ID=MMETSP0114-20121206/11299_1 /TAXON_ID=31324 /ORGANISM="Goniomonas sp, Strain m" /LENGTH=126 /DNA_ID=CAMNT_0001745663 /DNA_START=82 /DNA_END=462 /DNA_ORIENTATION=+
MPPKRDWKDMHQQITTEAEFQEVIAYKGLTIMEVYSAWCGPCECMVPTLRSLHWDIKEEKGAGVQFVAVASDKVESLKEYHLRSKPLFLFFRKGQRTGEVDGVNTHALRVFVEENAPSQGDIVASE